VKNSETGKPLTDEEAMRRHFETSTLGMLAVFRQILCHCGNFCPDDDQGKKSQVKTRVLSLLLGKMLPISNRSLANYLRLKTPFVIPSSNELSQDAEEIGEPEFRFIRGGDDEKDDKSSFCPRDATQILEDLEKQDIEDMNNNNNSKRRSRSTVVASSSSSEQKKKNQQQQQRLLFLMMKTKTTTMMTS